jgi:hypothetical protein
MPSGVPSVEFSAVPSGAHSSIPFASPSAAPSVSPSALPSAAPLLAPSSSPTLHHIQQIVEVEIVVEFAIGMASSNVPDLFDETVETGILGALPGFCGVVATVLSVTANNIRRRCLQNVVPVQFRIDIGKPCYLLDCNALTMNMISDLNNAVLTAVVDGSMQTFI